MDQIQWPRFFCQWPHEREGLGFRVSGFGFRISGFVLTCTAPQTPTGPLLAQGIEKGMRCNFGLHMICAW